VFLAPHAAVSSAGDRTAARTLRVEAGAVSESIRHSRCYLAGAMVQRRYQSNRSRHNKCERQDACVGKSVIFRRSHHGKTGGVWRPVRKGSISWWLAHVARSRVAKKKAYHLAASAAQWLAAITLAYPRCCGALCWRLLCRLCHVERVVT